MKNTIIKLFCLIAISVAISQQTIADPIDFYAKRAQLSNQPISKNNNINQFWFEQLIDHQQPDKGTYKQRYYVNEQYVENNHSPTFLYICGEATCRETSLQGAIAHYGNIFHARLVAVEHRYYGKSLPIKNLSTKNLKYLSTQAALDDLAHFQNSMMEDHNWQGKWVAFGGSYPGNLSAFYRLQHPELVVGALASSAPVKAKANFFEYDQHVSKVTGKTCLHHLQQAINTVEKAINNPEAFIKLKTKFEAKHIKDNTDFLYLMADIAASAVQYGSHKQFCDNLAQASSPIDGYANFARQLYKNWGLDPVQFTAQGAESIDPNDYINGFGLRQWIYQSCQEYGYWQNVSPDFDKRSRSKFINGNYHQSICKRLFNIDKPVNTERTNNQYYLKLLDTSTSRIFFTNGANDPWSNLSLAEKNGNNVNPNLSYQLLPNQAHCDDLRALKNTDSEVLKKSRNKMVQLIKKWLK